MVNKLIKGSKIPVIIEITEFDQELNAESEDVNIECTFFAIRPQEGKYDKPKTYKVSKTKSTNQQGFDKYYSSDNLFPLPDGNKYQYIAIVDTTGLDTGTLYVSTKLTYQSSEVNDEELVRDMLTETDIRIIDPFTPILPI